MEQTRIDEFGVDHSNFSLRDEIEYNFRRAKEREMKQSLQPQTFNTSRPEMLRSMPNTNWNDIITAGIIGTGEGTIAGTERFLNAVSAGKYGEIINSNFENAYTNRQNSLQNSANSAGLGNANRLANTAIDFSGTLLPYAYGLKKIFR